MVPLILGNPHISRKLQILGPKVGITYRFVAAKVATNLKLYRAQQRFHLRIARTLRVQVPNNHILPQNLYNYYYPKPKYLIIGYMDPLG